MVTYLIKSTLCLTLFLAFYHLVLEREKMHRFNRYYLLGSVFISFLAPLYTIYTKAIQKPIIEFTQLPDNTVFTQEIFPIKEPINYWNYLIYFSAGISILLLLKFFKNLYSIYRKVKISEKFKYQNSTIVLVADTILPHTFWNYIFINKAAYKTKKIEQELFTHELTHVAQKHTFDVLLIELLKVVFWFNPIFYFLKKSVQLNHEFLADTNVVSQHKNISKYQHLLINTSAWSNEYALASNLHYLVTKKRIVMMTKQTSKAVIRLKKLAVLPLIIGAIFLFAERVEAQEIVEIVEQPQNVQKNITKDSSIETIEEQIFTPQGEKVNTGFKDLNGVKHFFVKINNTIKYYNKKGQLTNKKGDILSNKQVNSNEIIPGSNISKTYFNGKIFCKFNNIDLNKSSKKIEEVIETPAKRKSSKQSISPNSTLKKRIHKDTIKKPISVKLEDLSASKSELKEYKSILAKGKKDRLFKQKDILKMKYLYSTMSKEQKNSVEDYASVIPPPPPPTRMMKKGEKSNILPPPIEKGWFQANNQTLYFVKEKGKTTYYNRWGNEVDKTGTKLLNGKNYKNKIGLPATNKTEKGYKQVGNQTLFYAKENDETKYFNRWGNRVDEKGKELQGKVTIDKIGELSNKEILKLPKNKIDNIKYYLNGKIISKKEIDKLNLNDIKTINVKKGKDGSGSIYIIKK